MTSGAGLPRFRIPDSAIRSRVGRTTLAVPPTGAAVGVTEARVVPRSWSKASSASALLWKERPPTVYCTQPERNTAPTKTSDQSIRLLMRGAIIGAHHSSHFAPHTLPSFTRKLGVASTSRLVSVKKEWAGVNRG